MSPKHPIRPKVPGATNEGSTRIRDTAPDNLRRSPVNTLNPELDQAQGHRFPAPSPLPDTQTPQIEVRDLPVETHISRVISEHPISDYYLPPRLVDRLPAAVPETGIRSIISGRQYVDLVDGGTVALGSDAQGHFRAKQMSELVPSGPRLERVPGTLEWRRLHPETMSTEDSQLVVSRHPLPVDEQEQAGPSKRPRLTDEEPSVEDVHAAIDNSAAPRIPEPDSSSAPWQNWGVSPQHASFDDISIDGVLYKTLPRGDVPEHPVVYIKHPEHWLYDFDSMQATLVGDIAQQPRGAIQVPPTHHWAIDPHLPFAGPLTDYVTTYFPELTSRSVLDIARNQFLLANGSEHATGIGLTTLRQVFNDWKTKSITPRPELADPLLMLPAMALTAGKGTARVLELPLLTDQSPLLRLEFNPRKFYEEWDYFTTSTQYAGDLKRFMARLLTRNGYTVFEPTTAQSYPALVFQRTGHDFVFYMTLHRVHGKKISIPPTSDQGFAPHRSLELIGLPAMRAVENAHAANKLIWLKGGSQISVDRPDSVFIVRSDDPRT